MDIKKYRNYGDHFFERLFAVAATPVASAHDCTEHWSLFLSLTLLSCLLSNIAVPLFFLFFLITLFTFILFSRFCIKKRA